MSKVEPIAQVVCHCINCQKQTGTAFSIVLLLQKANLNISRSSHATIPSFGDTGKETTRHFATIADCQFTPNLELAQALLP
tara:strand:+ start:205 stop:447 length:243 start_codon:yes stop_codon:yes gene_type:complete